MSVFWGRPQLAASYSTPINPEQYCSYSDGHADQCYEGEIFVHDGKEAASVGGLVLRERAAGCFSGSGTVLIPSHLS
jgi:hypothetical protein